MIRIIAFLFFVGLIFSCKRKENETTENPITVPFNETEEKEAIMKVIEAETICFYQRDFECWQQYFVHSEYAFQAWTNPDASFDAEVGWDNIAKRSQNYMTNNPVPTGGSSHPKVTRKNMVFKFFGDNFVYMIWDQYNSSPDLKTYNHSKDTRIMEKIDGNWKIANVTAFWDYKNSIPFDSIQ